jgi:non-ribosomal peptide synthetase component F
MEVLEDLVARDRRDDSTALRAAGSGRTYDYRRFCTTAWKVGNLLRHHGVRRGDVVAVADEPTPEPVLTLYGAACMGAVVRFSDRPGRVGAARAVVVPRADLDAEAVAADTKPVCYDGPHEDPSVGHFERDVWSENPAVPPGDVAAGDPLLEADRKAYTHRRVLEAAASVADHHGIGTDTTVAIDPAAPLTRPAIVAAGVVAPILAGGTVANGPRADADLVVGGPNGDIDIAAIFERTDRPAT